MAHIILFEHDGLRGAHKHIFQNERNLNRAEDWFFNDRVSSFVVVSGYCTFYVDSNYQNPVAREFGKGVYNWVEEVGIPNDKISSVKVRG